MHPSKWLVFIRPALAGFDRPLTPFGLLAILLAMFDVQAGKISAGK
jgi:hypothetical protein